jgi:aminoglycoside 2'-N-acetyltransferase I
VKLEIVHSVDIEESLRQRLLAWLYREFGTYTDEYAWAIADWHVLAWEGDLLVGHVDITERTASVGGGELRLGGIGGVVTLQEWRKRGIASAALERAARFLRDELAVPFGLLVCDPALTPFYQELGWQTVAGPLIFDQPAFFQPGLDQTISGGPTHKVTLEGAIMILPCREHGWPAGLIDLCGLPW